MNRYANQTTSNRYDGKRVLLTTLYPVVPIRSTDIFIESNEMMTLDFLAQKYYKDPTLWWIIARANSLGKGSLEVPIGIQIRIPTEVDAIVQEFNRINS
jgi:hypothetical protein